MTKILENFAERPDVFSEYLDGLRLHAREVRRATGRNGRVRLPGHVLLVLSAGAVGVGVGGLADTSVFGEGGGHFTARRALLLNSPEPVSVECTDATITAVGFSLEERAVLSMPASIPHIIDLGDLDAESWLSLSLNLLNAELDEPRPGGRSMVERILELILIQALRKWAHDSVRGESWLVAALDPHINVVLNELHRAPAHPWDLEELAARVNLSRSALAAKFTALIGMPPMRYLTRLRMQEAAQMLESRAAPIGVIAAQVGYTSEAAFSRAFSRHFGVPPKVWRARGGRNNADRSHSALNPRE